MALRNHHKQNMEKTWYASGFRRVLSIAWNNVALLSNKAYHYSEYIQRYYIKAVQRTEIWWYETDKTVTLILKKVYFAGWSS